MMNILKTFAAAGAVMLFAGAANAATVTNVSNGLATDECSLSNFTTSIACSGDISTANNGGNVASGDLDGVFQDADGLIENWMMADEISSVDQGNFSSEQQGAEGIFEIMLTEVEGALTGMWRLIAPATFNQDYYYAFAIKGSTDQAVYVMDTSIMSGDWTTFDLENSGGSPALSNIALFKAPGADMPEIPLPAAGWLLLGGLGGLAAMKRRRKS